MRTIYKYPFKIDEKVILFLPICAEILDIQVQNETPCIWALVQTSRQTEPREFRIYGTGNEIKNDTEDKDFIHVKTLHWHDFVWHIFEVKELPF